MFLFFQKRIFWICAINWKLASNKKCIQYYNLEWADLLRICTFLSHHKNIFRLDAEYKRDLAKGMDAEVPVHYYENDDPSTTPLLTWRGHANTLYTNWLNFYVYQATPYKW